MAVSIVQSISFDLLQHNAFGLDLPMKQNEHSLIQQEFDIATQFYDFDEVSSSIH